MAEWFSNGISVQHVGVADRGLQYGDGLFETIAIRNGEPRLWKYHVERLQTGCQRLQLLAPPESELLQAVKAAVEAEAATSATVKLVLTAGAGQRGYGRLPATTPELLIGVFPASIQPSAFYQEGVEATVCETRLATGSPLAGLKTLNRLEQVLASSELDRKQHFEGFTLDADGNIICGTMSNVFLVVDKNVITPSLERCGVAGTMRQCVLDTLAGEGVEVAIAAVPLAKLANADEVFLTNSQFGVLPVSRCGEHAWPVGAVTRKLQQALAMAGFPECRA